MTIYHCIKEDHENYKHPEESFLTGEKGIFRLFVEQHIQQNTES